MNEEVLRVGCAAGFSGDRTDAAAAVVETLLRERGPAVLIFETLAERTLALAQLERRNDPQRGYEPLLDELIAPVLEPCLKAGIRIVSNLGAANPRGAALRIRALAHELGLRVPRIAVIHGDDVCGPEHRDALAHLLGDAIAGREIVSANAYLGAETIAQALRAGAQIV